MTWIVVPNWPKFQHYTDRSPTWIKLYLELNSRDEWLALTVAERGLLVTIWIEYARSSGCLSVQKALSLCTKSARSKHVEALSQAGFITVVASKPLALARSREKEKRRPPKSPKPKTAKATGWREVRGSHGISWIPDPFGTDTPPIGRPL